MVGLVHRPRLFLTQEVDPLTEYQVYKQFGYESKAAESLAGYLNNLTDTAPEKIST